jgi:hypothetical protein
MARIHTKPNQWLEHLVGWIGSDWIFFLPSFFFLLLLLMHSPSSLIIRLLEYFCTPLFFCVPVIDLLRWCMENPGGIYWRSLVRVEGDVRRVRSIRTGMSVHHALHFFFCGVTSWNEFGGWDWDVVTARYISTSIFAPRTHRRGRGLDKISVSWFDS